MRQIIDNIVGANTNLQFSDIAVIENLSFPAQISPNTSFTVEYDAVNLSGSDQQMFGYILDASQTQIPGSNWVQTVPAGQSFHPSIFFEGITANLSGTVVIGHMEEEAGLPAWVIPAIAGVGVVVIVAIVAIKKPARKYA